MIDTLTQKSAHPLLVRDIRVVMTDVALSNKVGAMRFTVPTSTTPISISPSLIPRSTLAQVDNLQDQLQAKIDRGGELVDKLRHNTNDKPVVPTKQDVSDSRKERVNKPFIEGYQTLVSQMPDTVKDLLNQDDPLSKSGGIRVMSNNIDLVRDALLRGVGIQPQAPEFEEINLLDEDEPPVKPQLPQDGLVLGPDQGIDRETAIRLDGLLEQAAKVLDDAYGDGTIHLRIGNEVILGEDDF